MTGFDESAQATSLVVFIAVATIVLLLCVLAGPDRDNLEEFYAGYGDLAPLRNGLAIAGITSPRPPCSAPPASSHSPATTDWSSC